MHEIKASLRGLFVGPFRFIIIIVLASFVLGMANSCFHMISNAGPAPVDQSDVDAEP